VPLARPEEARGGVATAADGSPTDAPAAAHCRAKTARRGAPEERCGTGNTMALSVWWREAGDRVTTTVARSSCGRPWRLQICELRTTVRQGKRCIERGGWW
jgi:hypothetical protein